MPAQNARSPVPVITTARTLGSASAAATAAPMSPIIAQVSALRASGRLRRTTSPAPRRSVTTAASSFTTRLRSRRVVAALGQIGRAAHQVEDDGPERGELGVVVGALEAL